MKGTRYTLTLRRNEILKLYEDQFRFNLFSKENRTRLLYTVFFAVGLVVSSFNLFGYRDPLYSIIICMIGTGYNATKLFNDYNKTLTTKEIVNKWIDDVSQYKYHSIVMDDDAFIYHRDSQIFRYDLSKISQKVNNDKLFSLKLTDGLDIIIPAGSFDDNRFQEFIAEVDDIIRRISPHILESERETANAEP